MKQTAITLKTNELSNGTIMIEKITVTDAPWHGYYKTVYPRVDVEKESFILREKSCSYKTYRPFEAITADQLKDVKEFLKRAANAANELVVSEKEYIF